MTGNTYAVKASVEQQTRVQGNKCGRRTKNTHGHNHGATDATMGAGAGQWTHKQGWVNEGKGKG